MEPVSKLHQQDPDIFRHGKDHLAGIFSLFLDLALEPDFAELCNSIHDLGHVFAEHLLQFFQRGEGVLYRVMQETGSYTGQVQMQLCQNMGRCQGM